jgi:hypothetical protein
VLSPPFIVAAQFYASWMSTAERTTSPEYGDKLKISVAGSGASESTPQVFAGALVQTCSTPTVGGGAAGLPRFTARDVAVFSGSAASYARDVS